MKVFITGMAGFLGSHLGDYLQRQGHEVIGCDDYSTGDVNNCIELGLSCLTEDITQPSKTFIQALSDCDVVFHCAAAAYEGVSVFSPGFISENIYAGSAKVFSAAISAGVRRIVFTSLMARYGYTVTSGRPFSEADPPIPVDPYGLAKLSAEKLLLMLGETHGVEVLIAVPHNIYGPRQKYDDPYRNVAAIMANRMLQGKPPIIYGNGDQVRCFSYIDDVVPSLAALAEVSPFPTFDPIFNLGPDHGEVTINELALQLSDIIGFNSEVIYMSARPREVEHATCLADRARDWLGFEQKTQLGDGLEKLVAYIRKCGPKPFQYHMQLEIVNNLTPSTWSEELL